MTFPASLTLITLTGTFLDGEGASRAGVVTITLPTPIYSTGDDVIIPPFDLELELDDEGSFAAEVPATTDPEWLPNDASYVIQAVFSEDFRKLWWSVPLPYDAVGATVDLADVGAPIVGTPSLSIRQGTTQPLADGGYRSTWDVSTVYRAGDTVQHGSSIYGALRASTGTVPGTNAAIWKVFPGGGGGGAVDSVNGRTGDVVLVKADVGLTNVDNTSDANKPVSTAQSAADAVVAANASSALSTHAADTTGVHGIADTAALALATDVVLKALFTTKGDLVVATGSGTVVRLPVGSNGHVFTADSAESAGVKWAASEGGGGGSSKALITRFPLHNQPPVADPASIGWINSRPVLAFNDTTPQSAIFTALLPATYGGTGLTVYAHWTAVAVTGTVGWLISIERIGTSQDIDADSFASAQTITAATVPGTSGVPAISSVVISSGANMDSLAAGELFRIKIARDTANDTAVGNAYLLCLEIRET